MILSKESSYSNVKINSGENTAVLNLCTIHNSDFNLRRNILISRKKLQINFDCVFKSRRSLLISNVLAPFTYS